MQNDPVVSKASVLLGLGLMPTPEEVRAGKVGIFCLYLGTCGTDKKSRICFRLMFPVRSVFCPGLLHDWAVCLEKPGRIIFLFQVVQCILVCEEVPKLYFGIREKGSRCLPLYTRLRVL